MFIAAVQLLHVGMVVGVGQHAGDDPALAGAREGELLAQYRKTAEEICGRKLEKVRTDVD